MLVNTSATISYHPLNTFDVLAGTGPFNGSLVEHFLRTYNGSVPYFAIASTYSFINNPQFSVSLQPPSCAGGMTPCESYLLPGCQLLCVLDWSHGTSDNDLFLAADIRVERGSRWADIWHTDSRIILELISFIECVYSCYYENILVLNIQYFISISSGVLRNKLQS